jgi:uncharacterized protein (TIGR00299 family) protein
MEPNFRKIKVKIAYLDCFSGISGDMTLSALVACGVPEDYLKAEIKKIGLKDYHIEFGTVVKNHIAAKQVKIEFELSQQPNRNYTNIIDLIQKADLSDAVKKKSVEAFTILGEAEAKIHGIALEKIHFHEVGAVDSIIDLVGSIIAFEFLNVDLVYSAPVPLGTGFANTEHGVMPVPSPAAMEILQNYPVIHKDSGYEMTTPTGATIIKTLSQGTLPNGYEFTPLTIGFGAGSKQVKGWPNVLRLVLGETKDREKSDEKKIMIEANIDDLNPEFYPYIMEKILKAGANDVFLTQVIMKKGRPGTMISCVADLSVADKIEAILFTETSTIGLRKYDVQRSILERSEEFIETRYGKVKVKKITLSGRVIIRPEFEECKRLAVEKKVAIQDIYREIESYNQL